MTFPIVFKLADIMETKENDSQCPYKLTNPSVVFNGKWIQARQVNFKAPSGAEGVWQSVHRNTRPVGAPADGVGIIAKVRKQGKDYILLVKQYRIPVGKMCIEFPAGLIDANETAEQSALRELSEETGYVANKVLMQSAECFLDPGLTDDSQCYVVVEVDGDSKENMNPKQHLDSTEQIEVILVEHENLFNYLKNVDKSVCVESGVYSYAFGSQCSKLFSGK